MDKIIRGMLFEGKAIVDLIDTTDLVQKAIDYHKLSDDAACALGKVLTIGAFISSGFKGLKNKMSIIIQGNGVGGKIVVAADNGSKVRGYIENTKATGAIEDIVGKSGYINVIKDFGMKEPYNGLSQIVCGNIDLDFAYYFTTSEQLPSAISLGVDVKNGKCIKSSGVIVQPMPNCTQEAIVILEDVVSQLKDINSIIEQRGLEDTLDFYFGLFNLQRLEDVYPEYICTCSKEKIDNVLLSLGEKEARDIIEKEGKIEVGCQFCDKKYVYFEKEINTLFNG